MRVFYTDRFVLPLPEGHRFPMRKYSMLRERVSEALRDVVELAEPHAATDEEIRRVHDPDYLSRVQDGRLTRDEVRRLGFPWSAPMVERSRRSVGATIEACRAALEHGVSVSLAGGTHHAFRDRGEGFCVFNDSVVAARTVQEEQGLRRIIVIDCDVHQGDGTASLCEGDPSVFTFSIHGARNYPFRKQTSDLDIPLEDGTGDLEYLTALEGGVKRALDVARPQLAIYLAGADPWKGDRWGRLALTKNGLERRDRFVLDFCRRAGLPVVVTMAGGYAPQVEETVDIHFRTVVAAARIGDTNARHAWN